MRKNIASKIKWLQLISFLVLITSCQRDIYIGSAPELPPKDGKIFIQSSPSHVKIYYQRKNTGLMTPDSLTWFENGSHIITLKRELLKDTSFTVTTEENKTTNVFIDYYANPGHYGKFWCYSKPDGANIFINDSSTGFQTPHLFEHYFPDYYKIKLTKPEHRADSTVLAIEGGKLKSVFLTLEDTTKWVSYLAFNSSNPTNYYNDIITDHNNVKWAAADSGVVSFDGKDWHYYNYNNSTIPKGVTFKLAVDAANNIWAATVRGLFVFNGSSWMDYTGNLPSSVVLTVTNDKNGIVWIGTVGGLVRFDGAQWKVFNTQNSGIFGDAISVVSAASDGKIWFGSSAIGSYDGTNWTKWTFDNMKLDPAIGLNIKDLKVDLDGRVWVAHTKAPKIGIRGGFTMYDGSSWKEIKIPALQIDDIKSINVDGNNFKWIGTANGLGKFLQPENVSVLFHLSTQIPVENVSGVTLDHNGDLWIAGFGYGIAKIKKGNF